MKNAGVGAWTAAGRAEFLELPIDEILQGGLTSLPDDQLAELACRPAALVCLHELVDEMLDDDKAGNFWWEEIDRQETGTPDDVTLTESQQRTIERLKLLDAIDDRAARVFCPSQGVGRRCDRSSVLAPACLLSPQASSSACSSAASSFAAEDCGLRPGEWMCFWPA